MAILLYLNSEGKAEKVYCFSPTERSIAADCAGLTSTERLRQQMERAWLQATTHYSEYHAWFARATRVRPKAMDIFNQTVAVKDIQSLNRFIRDHMLEAKPWGEKVDNLLSHFTQLSEAHQSLVRVRRQDGTPRTLASGRDGLPRARRAAGAGAAPAGGRDTFFRQKTMDLFTPECAARREERAGVRKKKEHLGQRSWPTVQEECRRLPTRSNRRAASGCGKSPC